MTTLPASFRTGLRPAPVCNLRRGWAVGLLLGLSLASFPAPGQNPEASPPTLPVRGLHLSAPSKRDLPAALDFIRKTLPAEGVNTLILEFDYSYDFQSLPEFASPSSLGKAEARQLVEACREKGIKPNRKFLC